MEPIAIFGTQRYVNDAFSASCKAEL